MKPIPKAKTQTGGEASAPRPRRPAPNAPRRKQPSQPLTLIPKKPPQGLRSRKHGPATMTAGAMTHPRRHLGSAVKTETRAFRNLHRAIQKGRKQYNVLNREAARYLRGKLVPLLWKMRKEHFAQGRRRTVAGVQSWEEYCKSIRLKPDTVRDWFQKLMPAKHTNEIASH